MKNSAALALLALASVPPRREESVHRHEYHEHRAPTDDSVRLLSEMEAAALKKVVATIHSENNTLSVCGFIQETFDVDCALRGGLKLTLKVTLNGKDHTLTESLPGRYEARTSQEWADKVREMITAFVTGKVLGDFGCQVLAPAIQRGTVNLSKL